MKSKIIGRKLINWGVYSIAFASTIFIVYKLLTFSDWDDLASKFCNTSGAVQFVISSFIITLIIIYLEAAKWRYLLYPTILVSQKKSILSVLIGISTGIFTPGRVGEIAGRLIADNTKNTSYITSMFVVGSLIQTFITVLLGLIGLYIFKFDILNGKIFIGLLAFASLPLLIWALAKGVKRFFPQYYPTSAIEKAWLSLRQTSFNKVLISTLISLVKYSVYSLQLYLALHFFNPSLDLFYILPKIAIFYFGVTFLPGFLWADLGIRGSLSLFLFSTSVVQGASILIPIYFIWLLNSCLPALVGLMALLRQKKVNIK